MISEKAMFKDKEPEWRIDKAKQITKRLVDHAVDILWISETNAVTIYSNALAKQIPRSYAAHAFNVFRRAMHQIEIVRLCALWDKAKTNLQRETIPTVIELIDHPNVLERLCEAVRAQYPPVTEDGDLANELDHEVINFFRAKHANERAEQANSELKTAIKNARDVFSSDRLKAIRVLRDFHVAHNLAQEAKAKVGTVQPMEYGDEKTVLNETLSIIKTLYCWVNGIGFSFEGSRTIDRKCVEDLWPNCVFTITPERSRQGAAP